MALEEIFDLAVVIEAVDRFTAPIKAMESSMASADVRMKTIQKTMKNMGSSADEIKNVGRALKDLKVEENFAKMASDLERIGKSSEEIDALRQSYKNLADQQERVEELHHKMKKWGKVALVGAAATGGGLVLGDVMLKSLEKAGEFQSKMTVIKDVTGATQTQMNKLSDSIMNVSTKVSKFNDMQLVGFAQQLSSGGFSNVKDVQKLVLPVAQFAEAQVYEGKQTDPTEAAKQAIEMAHMFKHYDPKSFTQFLDTFNKYSNMQPGSSTDLYQTLTYLAPTAQRQLGMSEKDTMALAAVANRVGLTGSHGGTNAADMILRLIPGLVGGTKPKITYAGSGKNKHIVSETFPKALQAMMNLGLADSKGNSKFFKNGHITNLSAMIQTLINASKGKSKEELTKDYKDIFGIQGGRAASILSDKSTIEQLQGMQKQLGKTKSMEQIQKDISKTPQGQLDLLKSNSMTAQLRFAQALGPLLNPIITKLNKMLMTFLKIEQQHPKMMKYVGLFLLMSTGLLLIAGPLTSLIGLFGMLGTGIKLAMTTSVVKNMIGGMKQYVSLMRVGSRMAAGSLVKGIRSAGSAVLTFGRSALIASGNIAKMTLSLIANTAKTIALRTAQFAVMAAQRTWTGVMIAFNAVMDANPIALIILGIAALIAIIIVVVTHWKTVVKWVQTFWHWLLHLKDGVLIVIAAFAPFIGLPILIIKHWQQIKTWFNNLVKDMKGVGHNIVEGLWNGISGMGSWLGSKIGSFVSNHLTGPFKHILGIHSPSKVFAEHGMYIVQGLAQGIDNNNHIAESSVKGLARKAMDGISGVRGSSSNGSNSKDQPIIIQIYADKSHDEEAIADKVVKKLGKVSRKMSMSSGARLNIQSMG